jgi:hypothetical protein
MSGKPGATCLAPETLTAYCVQGLTEAQEAEVEAHLATCDACTADARALHELRAGWDAWTPRAHGDAYLRARLDSAIEAAGRVVPSAAWRERLARWRDRFASAADGAVRVALEETARTSHLVTEGLDALLRPGARWRFAPAPAVVRTRGAVRTRGGAPTRAIPSRIPVRTRGSVPTPAPVTAALAPGQPQARITLSGDGRSVEVQVEAPAGGPPPPLVLLVPDRPDAAPEVKEPARQGAMGAWIARFDILEPGDYLVLFEPSA